MRTISVNDLGHENFNPIFINALRQQWKSTKSFQCIGTPKQQNLLLFLDGCKIEYTDKQGQSCVAVSGDVVYTPLGSEYKATLSDFISTSSHTIGINFLLFDEFGEPLVLSDEITVFRFDDMTEISAMFERSAITDKGHTTINSRIILLEILSLLAVDTTHKETSIVSETIQYLSLHIDENPSIADLSKRCGVSEVYLRKKFKESIGISPAKYRNELRLNKAASYLKFGDISVQEISDTLGYCTVSHFIKEFKAHFGISPLQYRKEKSIT